MLAFIMIELFAKGLIEAHHLGFEGGGVEGFLVYAYTKKLPERAVPPETGPKKKEETHYAKPLHA